MFVLVVRTDGETMYINPRYVISVEARQESSAVLRMHGGDSVHIKGGVQAFIEKVSALLGRDGVSGRRASGSL